MLRQILKNSSNKMSQRIEFLHPYPNHTELSKATLSDSEKDSPRRAA